MEQSMNQSVNQNKKVTTVIFDWAGTIVDYGCFAPAVVFVAAFKKKGIDITLEQARLPMGLEKKEHIKTICQMEEVSENWRQVSGKEFTDNDIDDIYNFFIPMQLSILPEYSELIPGALDTIEYLKSQNIKIGSTTGYNTTMMNIVVEESRKRGLEVDSLVCADEVPGGRPYPWMVYKNAISLREYPLDTFVKVGDTVPDILEGVNAGAWSIGVIKSGNEMGLTEKQVYELNDDQYSLKKAGISDKLNSAGAHYVIDSIEELPGIIEEINTRLANGERP
jgi:phosphonoacetaldehyde hydrolase